MNVQFSDIGRTKATFTAETDELTYEVVEAAA